MNAVFPSSRVGAASFVDRDTLTAEIAALYDQLDRQDTSVASYHSLKKAFRDQKLQIDRLYLKSRSSVEIAPRLETYVQARFIGLWADFQNSIERQRAFQMVLARRLV